IEARQPLELLLHRGDEALVAFIFQVGGVRAAADQADRLVAEAAQQRVVAAGRAGAQRQLEAGPGVLLQEAQRVRPGKALAYAVAIGDLRDERRIVRRHERRPDFLDDLAAVALESLLD